jgi:Kef-type K+ transport system membrane component KefB
VTFGTLTLIVAAGLAGPLLAGLRGSALPLVIGEIGAGVVIGNSGFQLIDPTDPVLVFLSQIGFAMLMFVVGTRLPLRNPDLRAAIARAAGAAAAAMLVAVPFAIALSHLTTIHRTGLFIPLVATSSAAVALPIVQERGLSGPVVLAVTAWITVADIATIVVVPLVTSSGSAVKAGLGAVLVTLAALGMFLAARGVSHTAWVAGLRDMSRRREWALDLRVSLVALFALVWLAVRFQTGVLVAGFAAGAVVALAGEPKRLVQQLLGLAEGFFVPLFFVTLGARLDVRHLVSSPSDLWLTAALAGSAVACHLIAAAVMRLPPGAGMLATAQLGVPTAVAALGLANGSLDQGEAAAVVAAALLLLAVATGGALLLAREEGPSGEKIRRPG